MWSEQISCTQPPLLCAQACAKCAGADNSVGQSEHVKIRPFKQPVDGTGKLIEAFHV
jgi:hypothetical protein